MSVYTPGMNQDNRNLLRRTSSRGSFAVRSTWLVPIVDFGAILIKFPNSRLHGTLVRVRILESIDLSPLLRK